MRRRLNRKEKAEFNNLGYVILKANGCTFLDGNTDEYSLVMNREGFHMLAENETPGENTLLSDEDSIELTEFWLTDKKRNRLFGI